MAASLVNGSTLHSTFQLEFGDELTNLADSPHDKLRSKLEELVILIVDEISMVRSDRFYQLHERLQSVKKTIAISGVFPYCFLATSCSSSLFAVVSNFNNHALKDIPSTMTFSTSGCSFSLSSSKLIIG